MTAVYVSIGSNINRENSIRFAVHALESQFGCLTLSSVYETAAVGFVGDPFFNMAVGFNTELTVKQVLAILHIIEACSRRKQRQKKFEPRALDIDLLLFGSHISAEPCVNIPRDELTHYAFMLEPLAEIAGDVSHPKLSARITDLWSAFDKHAIQQTRIKFDFMLHTSPIASELLDKITAAVNTDYLTGHVIGVSAQK